MQATGTKIEIPVVRLRGLSVQYMSVFSIVIYAGAFIGYFFYAYLADKFGRRLNRILCRCGNTVLNAGNSEAAFELRSTRENGQPDLPACS